MTTNTTPENCPTCNNTRKTWNALLNEHRPCIDCVPSDDTRVTPPPAPTEPGTPETLAVMYDKNDTASVYLHDPAEPCDLAAKMLYLGEKGNALANEIVSRYNGLHAANRELAEARAEGERLRQWKESAISVMPDMQAIGAALNVTLGTSVHDKILPGIVALRASRDEAVKALEEANKSADAICRDFMALLMDEPRQNGSWPHLIICNGSHRVRIGDHDDEICNCPLGKRIKHLRTQLTTATARLAEAERDTSKLLDALSKVERVRNSMAQSGHDFFIDGGQRAAPLLFDAANAYRAAIDQATAAAREG